jgi:hypothetical protein
MPSFLPHISVVIGPNSRTRIHRQMCNTTTGGMQVLRHRKECSIQTGSLRGSTMNDTAPKDGAFYERSRMFVVLCGLAMLFAENALAQDKQWPIESRIWAEQSEDGQSDKKDIRVAVVHLTENTAGLAESVARDVKPAIDAIARGARLTKADAARMGWPIDDFQKWLLSAIRSKAQGIGVVLLATPTERGAVMGGCPPRCGGFTFELLPYEPCTLSTFPDPDLTFTLSWPPCGSGGGGGSAASGGSGGSTGGGGSAGGTGGSGSGSGGSGGGAAGGGGGSGTGGGKRVAGRSAQQGIGRPVTLPDSASLVVILAASERPAPGRLTQISFSVDRSLLSAGVVKNRVEVFKARQP